MDSEAILHKLIEHSNNTLSVRRKTLTEMLYKCNGICSTFCIHYLLPVRHDSLFTDKLRNCKIFYQLLIKTLKLLYLALRGPIYISNQLFVDN